MAARTAPPDVRDRILPMADELLVKLRRLWLLVGWTLVVVIVYLSLTPDPIGLPVEGGDKLGHGLAYLVLMSWFANLYEGTRRHVWCAAGSLALAVGLEFAQRWTDTRSFEAIDMLAGATGIALAWVLAPPRLPNYLGIAERLYLAWRGR